MVGAKWGQDAALATLFAQRRNLDPTARRELFSRVMAPQAVLQATLNHFKSFAVAHSRC